jgi:hypothetical protein
MDTSKSKDGLKPRKDMVQLNVMPELHPVEVANGKYTLPMAIFNLTPEEKRAICTFLRGGQSPDWVFSKCEEASVNEGLVNNTLQGSRLSCDADSVSTYCNQGYKARVLDNGHHLHVLLLFEDLIEDDWQERAE